MRSYGYYPKLRAHRLSASTWPCEIPRFHVSTMWRVPDFDLGDADLEHRELHLGLFDRRRCCDAVLLGELTFFCARCLFPASTFAEEQTLEAGNKQLGHGKHSDEHPHNQHWNIWNNATTNSPEHDNTTVRQQRRSIHLHKRPR